MALLASTAMADEPGRAQPPPVMDGLPAARAAGDVTGLGTTATRQPGGHFDWENVSAEQRAMEWPRDESSSPVWGLAVFASAILILVLTILGLTLSYRSLRAEMRRKRVTYRPRGPHTARESV